MTDISGRGLLNTYRQLKKIERLHNRRTPYPLMDTRNISATYHCEVQLQHNYNRFFATRRFTQAKLSKYHRLLLKGQHTEHITGNS